MDSFPLFSMLGKKDERKDDDVVEEKKQVLSALKCMLNGNGAEAISVSKLQVCTHLYLTTSLKRCEFFICSALLLTR